MGHCCLCASVCRVPVLRCLPSEDGISSRPVRRPPGNSGLFLSRARRAAAPLSVTRSPATPQISSICSLLPTPRSLFSLKLAAVIAGTSRRAVFLIFLSAAHTTPTHVQGPGRVAYKRHLFLSPEGCKPKITLSAHLARGEGRLPGSRSSCCVCSRGLAPVHVSRGSESGRCSSSREGTPPIMEATSAPRRKLITSWRPRLLKPSHWGLELQPRDSGRTQTFSPSHTHRNTVSHTPNTTHTGLPSPFSRAKSKPHHLKFRA